MHIIIVVHYEECIPKLVHQVHVVSEAENLGGKWGVSITSSNKEVIEQIRL